MKLKPAATKASSSSNDRCSSAVQPNTLPPKHSGSTFRPEWPSSRASIAGRLLIQRQGGKFLPDPSAGAISVVISFSHLERQTEVCGPSSSPMSAGENSTRIGHRDGLYLGGGEAGSPQAAERVEIRGRKRIVGSEDELLDADEL